MKTATDNVARLKKEIAGLRRGIRPEGQKDNAKFDFAEEIENREKSFAEAEKKLASLTGKDGKAAKTELTNREKASQLKAEQKARERQIEEYTSSLAVQQKQSEFDIRQAGVDEMKEGVEKEKKQIQLNFEKLEEENRLRKEKMDKRCTGKSHAGI